MESASTGPTVLSFADLIFTFERWPGGAPWCRMTIRGMDGNPTKKENNGDVYPAKR
jgi:hypothetical protein